MIPTPLFMTKVSWCNYPVTLEAVVHTERIDDVHDLVVTTAGDIFPSVTRHGELSVGDRVVSFMSGCCMPVTPVTRRVPWLAPFGLERLTDRSTGDVVEHIRVRHMAFGRVYSETALCRADSVPDLLRGARLGDDLSWRFMARWRGSLRYVLGIGSERVVSRPSRLRGVAPVRHARTLRLRDARDVLSGVSGQVFALRKGRLARVWLLLSTGLQFGFSSLRTPMCCPALLMNADGYIVRRASGCAETVMLEDACRMAGGPENLWSRGSGNFLVECDVFPAECPGVHPFERRLEPHVVGVWSVDTGRPVNPAEWPDFLSEFAFRIPRPIMDCSDVYRAICRWPSRELLRDGRTVMVRTSDPITCVDVTL